MVGHLFGRSDVQTAGVSWWGRYGISVLTIIIVAGLIGFGYANMQAYNEQDVTATGNNAFSKHDVPGLGMPYDRVLAGVGIPVALFDDYSDVLYLFLVPFLLVLVILYGIFNEIGSIFPNSPWIPKVLAVLFALLMLPLGIFSAFVYLFATVGTVALLIFGGGGIILIALGWAKHKLVKPGVVLVGSSLDKIVNDTEKGINKGIDDAIADLNTALAVVLRERQIIGIQRTRIIQHANDPAGLKKVFIALKAIDAKLKSHGLAKFENDEMKETIRQVRAILNKDKNDINVADLNKAADYLFQICVAMSNQLNLQLDAEHRMKVKTRTQVTNENIENL